MSRQDLLVLMVVVGLAVTGYLTLVVAPSRRSEREKASRPLLQHRCPLRAGWGPFFYLGGFGRVALYDDFLVAIYLLRSELDYRDIERVELRRQLLRRGLYFYPRAGKGPRYVAVFPHDPAPMVAILQAKGLRIEGLTA
ncbi:MAG: hypothetical protein DI596_10540 [Azospira oryzae]|uniref:Uncharacterized protein n=1 Tax=Pelomicrobium methylotrophicum TaxID=2602750 RepID=A0A5C7EJZ2_9PROT|nr:hypothetical protein [Pelomicrobium methylotrophicum]PZP56242.1 MAG: hypothetical protein DI596_10540 [Azospira oryzae]PZP78382.1 MAG: hypothetical protein DI593_10540 [Azospira oryzae]TXF11323.1 hypothetical protein FR698_10475 [Pelomicrobium methylotrophicum]